MDEIIVVVCFNMLRGEALTFSIHILETNKACIDPSDDIRHSDESNHALPAAIVPSLQNCAVEEEEFSEFLSEKRLKITHWCLPLVQPEPLLYLSTRLPMSSI